MDNSQFCCTTLTFAGPIERKLAAMAKAGFSSIEVWPRDMFEPFAGLAAVTREIAANGLSIGCYQGLRDYEGAEAPRRDRALDYAEHLMDQMQAAGADMLVLCSNTDPEADGDHGRLADDLSMLGDRAAARGMRIAYEALCYTPHVSDYRDAWKIVERAAHPHVGLVLDSAHVFALQLPLDGLDEIPSQKVFLVELSDLPDSGLPMREVNGNYRMFPGEGARNIVDFVERIEAKGYRGLYAAEVFSAHYREMDPDLVARRAHASLEWLAGEVAAAPRG